MLEETIRVLAENRESVLRLFMAAVLGGLIGLEREARSKPAGFRTNMLICLGAALLTEVSTFVARDAMTGGYNADPGRISAQIVSGVGFLGAGTIMQARGSVTGLTTAATLWVVAAIGMAVGAGAYLYALIATLLVMLALILLGKLDDRLLPRLPTERILRVVLEPRSELVSAVERQINEAGYQIRSVDVETGPETFTASFVTRSGGRDYDRALNIALSSEGVRHVTLT